MAQTPRTWDDYVGDGVEDTYQVTFPYQKAQEVFVTVDGDPVEFTFISEGWVRLAAAPASGAAIRIRRSTEAYEPRHEFENGVPLLPRFIDENNKQFLYVVQEAVNETAGTAAEALTVAEEARDIAQAASDKVDAAVIESAHQLRLDLADSTDPAKGGNLVAWRGDLTVTGAIDRAFSGVAYVEDYGVIGSTIGNLVDDTAAFVAACDDCRARGLRLNIGTKKIYLPTLAGPIDLDGFIIEGAGSDLYLPMDDWGVPRGVHDETVYLVPDALQQNCAVLIHTGFDGALFTGKYFNAQNLGILGNFNLPNNRAFEQTTPTAYPGWSQALRNTNRVSIGYTGSDGILLKGGLEVLDVGRIDTKFCGGHGLHVSTTAGIESPVEYLTFTEGRFSSSRKENIRLDGVRKHIDFGPIVVNDPGMIRLRMGGGAAAPNTNAPTSEANLVAAIRLGLDGAASVYGIRLTGVIAEYCNLMVRTTGNYTRGLEVKEGTLFPAYEAGWIWRYGILAHANTVDGVFMRNYGNLDSPASFVFNNHGVGTVILTDNITRIAGIQARQVQRFLSADPRSETIGDGSAGSFTTSQVVQPLEQPSADNPGFTQLLVINANFQGTTGNGAGAYLLLITRGAGGNYVGIAFPGSSTTGFTGAPKVDPTTGYITVPLARYYRCRISRIDHGELTSTTMTL